MPHTGDHEGPPFPTPLCSVSSTATTLAKLDSTSATTLRVSSCPFCQRCCAASLRSGRMRGNCYAVSRDARKCLVLRTQQCCKDCPRPTDVDELFWGLCLLG